MSVGKPLVAAWCLVINRCVVICLAVGGRVVVVIISSGSDHNTADISIRNTGTSCPMHNAWSIINHRLIFTLYIDDESLVVWFSSCHSTFSQLSRFLIRVNAVMGISD